MPMNLNHYLNDLAVVENLVEAQKPATFEPIFLMLLKLVRVQLSNSHHSRRRHRHKNYRPQQILTVIFGLSLDLVHLPDLPGLPDPSDLPGLPDPHHLPGLSDLSDPHHLPGLPDLPDLPGPPDPHHLPHLPHLALLVTHH